MVAILISHKIYFKTKAIKRDKEHCILLNTVIHQEEITLVNIYVLNIGAPKYIWKIFKDFKKDMNSNILIVGDLNTLLSTTERSSIDTN